MDEDGLVTLPEPRIGDAERDDAATLLQDHLAAGRITHAEFDERITAALEARTQADLDALFIDLPGRRPGHGRTPGGHATMGRPGEMAPAEREDQPAVQEPQPWWTHWGLFALTILLSAVSRGRLAPLVLPMALWVFWIGPSVARSQYQRRLQGQPRRGIGR